MNQKYFENAINKSNEIIIKMSQTIEDFRNILNPSKEKVPFSLHKTISFSLHLIEERIRSNNINIKIPANSNVVVWGYPNEFSQVISNVLNNAIDALIESNVSKKTIQINILQKDTGPKVKIFNYGNKISAEIMDKMFIPYFTTFYYEKVWSRYGNWVIYVQNYD